MTNQQKLSAKQARWISYLNLFNYNIHYREGALNKVADGLSRQYSNEPSNEKEQERIKLELNFLQEIPRPQAARSRLRIMCLCTESSATSTLLDEIKKSQAKDEQCIRILKKKLSSEDVVKDYRVRNGVVTFHDKYFISPNVLMKNRLLQIYHDHSGHVGRQKIYELLNRLCLLAKYV